MSELGLDTRLRSYYKNQNSRSTEPVSQTCRELEHTYNECAVLLKKSGLPELQVPRHKEFLLKMLGKLPKAFTAVDASRPWLIFWGLNGLSLMGQSVAHLADQVCHSILKCQHADGGFGGNERQPAHLAPTYASVMSLALVEKKDAWTKIDRKGMYRWLMSLKQSDGSFRVCLHGEVDPRATYCALVVASVLDILTTELTSNVASYIKSCQTYEGGFANQPLGEAHGGYAFCSLGSLYLVDPANPTGSVTESVNIPRFLDWLSTRQEKDIGGFSGRVNKLVDGCYSHWVGGCWALIDQICPRDAGSLWNRQGLRRYTLCCCQNEQGGLRDKPSSSPDAYHTNYVLCGLAAADYRYKIGHSVYSWSTTKLADDGVVPINPVFGTPLGVVEKMHEHFSKLHGPANT